MEVGPLAASVGNHVAFVSPLYLGSRDVPACFDLFAAHPFVVRRCILGSELHLCHCEA